MGKINKTLGLLGLGALLIALNLGGAAGCGDSDGGSSGSGIQNPEATQAAMIKALGGLSQFAQPDPTAGLQVGLKLQTGDCTIGEDSISCPCDNSGGSFSISGLSSTETTTLEFVNCIFDDNGDGDLNDDSLLDGTATITANGDTGSTIDFENFLVDLLDCGQFIMNGTETVTLITDTEANVLIDMAVTSGSESFDINGDVDVSEAGDTSLLNGQIVYSGDLSATCNFVDTDASVCPDVASACGISTSEICSGDDYLDASDVCL